MADLIGELKQEHVELAGVLTKIHEMGISSKESRAMLLAAREALLAHLNKEDEQLYPYLREKAAQNPDLQRTLDSFAADMQKISTAALDFFDRYTSPEAEHSGFVREAAHLIGTLQSRILREESILYPEYHAG
jgi:DUF438 domain-containing protein